jgi:hypothetical protein
VHARPGTARPSDVPDFFQLLDSYGCVLCRTRDNAVVTWLRWFNRARSDPVALATSAGAAGFCPAHARRVLRGSLAPLLRMPWEAALDATIAVAEGLVGGEAPPAPVACPICQSCAERERTAAEDLIASLRLPAIAAALCERGGLCYAHLRSLAPRLGPQQAAIAAEAVTAWLAGVPPDTPAACRAVAGYDTDASDRGRLLAAHAEILARSSDDQPDGADARDQLVADLSAGSCPLCRVVGRHQARYLSWVQERWPDRGLSSLQLCSAHLCDMWAAGPEAPRVTTLHAAAAARYAERLAGLARAVAADPRSARRVPATSAGIRRSAPPDGSARAGPRPVSVLEEYRIARAEVARDTYCRACGVGERAERRALALIRACRDDARVTRAIEDAHGACLRHARAAWLDSGWPPERCRPGTGLPADLDPAWQPLLIRLATQLRQAKWELDEDAEKRIWDNGYQPPGAEQLAWRRIPALLDGRVYLGLSEAEARATEPGATEPGATEAGATEAGATDES